MEVREIHEEQVELGLSVQALCCSKLSLDPGQREQNSSGRDSERDVGEKRKCVGYLLLHTTIPNTQWLQVAHISASSVLVTLTKLQSRCQPESHLKVHLEKDKLPSSMVVSKIQYSKDNWIEGPVFLSRGHLQFLGMQGFPPQWLASLKHASPEAIEIVCWQDGRHNFTHLNHGSDILLLLSYLIGQKHITGPTHTQGEDIIKGNNTRI